MESGTLAVALLSASGLKDVEGVFGGKQDPYALLTVGNKSYRSNTNAEGGKSPVWNQLFTYYNVSPKDELNVELYDENVVMKDKLIGSCSLPLNQIPLSMQPLDVRLPVYTAKRKQEGELMLKIQFQPLSAAPGATPRVAASDPSGRPPMAPTASTASYRSAAPMHGTPPGQFAGAVSQREFAKAPSVVSARQVAPQASVRSREAGGAPQRVTSGRSVMAGPAARAFNPALGSANARYRPDVWVLPAYANTACWEHYEKGPLLGKGTYGTTYLGTKRGTTDKVAIKVISKRKLSTPEEVGDVQREVKVLHHLKGHANIVQLRDVFEDRTHIFLVTELCTGGELFDMIQRRGEFTEYDAANVMRPILNALEHMHNMGVVHRDIKPENFLLASKFPGAPIKVCDFGLSCFFKEGEVLSERVGSAYYVAPEVLRRQYSKEADVWSAGVILYILLSGEAPFQGVTEEETFHKLMEAPIKLTDGAWDHITDEAKDCVRIMLERDPRKRASAVEVLKHEWMRENGCASDNPIEAEVFRRIKKFSGMNPLMRESLLVIAGALPLDEISGLREMFLEIDKDRSGTITVDEFTTALQRKGQKINLQAAKQVMAAADINGDGILDYEEFLAAMVNAGKLDREENLKIAFEQFDTDGSGSITRDELKQALQSKTQLSEAEIDNIIDEADRDGDGEIDFHEFCLMMRNM